MIRDYSIMKILADRNPTEGNTDYPEAVELMDGLQQRVQRKLHIDEVFSGPYKERPYKDAPYIQMETLREYVQAQKHSNKDNPSVVKIFDFILQKLEQLAHSSEYTGGYWSNDLPIDRYKKEFGMDIVPICLDAIYMYNIGNPDWKGIKWIQLFKMKLLHFTLITTNIKQINTTLVRTPITSKEVEWHKKSEEFFEEIIPTSYANHYELELFKSEVIRFLKDKIKDEKDLQHSAWLGSEAAYSEMATKWEDLIEHNVANIVYLCSPDLMMRRAILALFSSGWFINQFSIILSELSHYTLQMGSNYFADYCEIVDSLIRPDLFA